MNNTAEAIKSAFFLLRDKLEELPNAPKTPAEFYDRLVNPAAVIRPDEPAPQLPRMLTIKESAKLLKVDRRTICNMRKDGRLPCMQAGRVIRIPESSIAALIQKGETHI